MKESEIQNFLYNHPEYLFPGKTIQEISREYYIRGKRIDLLVVIDNIRYIVELKAVPLQRENIGQVIEYYGLMREYFSGSNLQMILVAPEFPYARNVFLEELGIRCVEFKEELNSNNPLSRSDQKVIKKKISSISPNLVEYYEPYRREDIACDVNKRQLDITASFIKSLLSDLNSLFSEYEITPRRKRNIGTLEWDYECFPSLNYGRNQFTKTGVWFSFSFGPNENMPPNDVPNISVVVYETGMDFTINAEISKSREYMIETITRDKTCFDNLLSDSGLSLKTYHKVEHQPRIYHWILNDYLLSGTYSSNEIISINRDHINNFSVINDKYNNFVIKNNHNLTEPQISHIKTRNRNSNLAFRLVKTLPKDDSIWEKDFDEQKKEFMRIIKGLKPFIDFFQNKA